MVVPEGNLPAAAVRCGGEGRMPIPKTFLTARGRGDSWIRTDKRRDKRNDEQITARPGERGQRPAKPHIMTSSASPGRRAAIGPNVGGYP